ncbi:MULTISPECIES: class I SAM-dependent methyltransferase [unclassified Synechococcus]|uniref:class I SAM-dependent methyltransferase n=1 Tax=unclassified Synechococcus TaxID=2626047 RepID=UPI00164AF8B7
MNRALNQGDIYSSPPNRSLIERTTGLNVHNFLDVGAGTGNNLKEFQRIHPYALTAAITCSRQESLELKKLTQETFIFDLNNINNKKERQKSGLEDLKYDLILLSHVLEHTQDPLNVLNGICNLLSPNGKILIALPNICHWRTRMQIARGKFQYQNDGILDRTHLRFFSYWSAIELVSECTELALLDNWAVGGSILGPIRSVLPNRMCKWLDHQATNRRPNLFGYEIHLLARKRNIHSRH